MTTCSSDREFVCGKLRVPLDHSGRARGSLSLEVAAQREYPKDAGLLIALSGGPGQSSVDAAGSFALSLDPLLSHYRLVVLDQRGTGAGALKCPELQRIGALEPFTPAGVAALREARSARGARFFSTADTRRRPRRPAARVRRAQGGADGDQLRHLGRAGVRAPPSRRAPTGWCSTRSSGRTSPRASCSTPTRALPRVLREQCARSHCKGATKHPVADLGEGRGAAAPRADRGHALRRARAAARGRAALRGAARLHDPGRRPQPVHAGAHAGRDRRGQRGRLRAAAATAARRRGPADGERRAERRRSTS